MRIDDGRVVSNFIVQALRNEDITIYGDGTQTRSFCYIDDMVEGITKFVGLGEDFTGPLNLGNPDEYTIQELAEIILKLTNSKAKLVYKDLPSDDPKRRRPDITLAKKKLLWEPKTSLDDGIQQTISYFSNLIA
jgi:UDP-glucuronate decarboxylase